MADVALREGIAEVATPSRAQVLARMRLADKAFQYLTHAMALGVLGLLACIIIALFIGSLPVSYTHLTLPTNREV